MQSMPKNKHEKPHPRIKAPAVLPTVGGTDTGSMTKSESESQRKGGEGQSAPD